MTEDVTLQLTETIFNIARFMKHEMNYSDNLVNLSMLQIQTLKFLSFNDKASMGDIAEHFHIELPSATSLINKLCEQSLVERFDDPQDRRLVRLGLTADGKNLLEKAIRVRKSKLEKFLSYLTHEEKTGLLHIMNTLEERLKK